MIDTVLTNMVRNATEDNQYLAANVFLKRSIRGAESYLGVNFDPSTLNSGQYFAFTVEPEMQSNASCIHMVPHDEIEYIEIYIGEF